MASTKLSRSFDCSRGDFLYACVRCGESCRASDGEFAELVDWLCLLCLRDRELEAAGIPPGARRAAGHSDPGAALPSGRSRSAGAV